MSSLKSYYYELTTRLMEINPHKSSNLFSDEWFEAFKDENRKYDNVRNMDKLLLQSICYTYLTNKPVYLRKQDTCFEVVLEDYDMYKAFEPATWASDFVLEFVVVLEALYLNGIPSTSYGVLIDYVTHSANGDIWEYRRLTFEILRVIYSGDSNINMYLELGLSETEFNTVLLTLIEATKNVDLTSSVPHG